MIDINDQENFLLIFINQVYDWVLKNNKNISLLLRNVIVLDESFKIQKLNISRDNLSKPLNLTAVSNTKFIDSNGINSLLIRFDFNFGITGRLAGYDIVYQLENPNIFYSSFYRNIFNWFDLNCKEFQKNLNKLIIKERIT